MELEQGHMSLIADVSDGDTNGFAEALGVDAGELEILEAIPKPDLSI
jgi:hypothetical protein